MIWGSDFPNVSDMATYEQVLTWLRHVDGLSTADREWLTGRSIRELLDSGWPSAVPARVWLRQWGHAGHPTPTAKVPPIPSLGMTDSSDGTLQLVTRGDDAGLAESANRAVRECFEEGILRNVSVMAPAPALEHAVTELADLQGLCVGLHVTLASEWESPSWGPVLPPEEVPSLVNNVGEFYASPAELFEHSPDRGEVCAEMKAQLVRLRDAGFEVTYADAHMLPERHSDWFGDELADFCLREGLIDGTDIDFLPGHGFEVDPDWLLERLDDVESGTHLLVGHPAYNDEETAEIYGGQDRGDVGPTRETQRRMFTDKRVLARVMDGDIRVIRYDET